MTIITIRQFLIKLSLLFLLLSCKISLFAQTKVTWKELSDVRYEVKYLEEFGAEYMTPIFGKTPKIYSDKKVLVTGYVIPVDAEENAYILSKNPYASCFFCGNAGAETIVELWIPVEKRKRYKMDERMTFKGQLKLNDEDVNHFIYILEGAEEY